jgi:hypothetical protein
MEIIDSDGLWSAIHQQQSSFQEPFDLMENIFSATDPVRYFEMGKLLRRNL